jgi:hypothetical protein
MSSINVFFAFQVIDDDFINEDCIYVQNRTLYSSIPAFVEFVRNEKQMFISYPTKL